MGVNANITHTYPRWTYIMLRAVRDGISVDYLYQGIKLAGEFNPDYRFSVFQQCQDFSRSTVDEVLYRLPEDEVRNKVMYLWESASQLPGLCKEVLANVAWQDLTPQQVKQYLQLLFSFTYYADTKKEITNRQAKWNSFKQHKDVIEKHTLSIDETNFKQWRKDFSFLINPYIDEEILDEVIETSAVLATKLVKYQAYSD